MEYKLTWLLILVTLLLSTFVAGEELAKQVPVGAGLADGYFRQAYTDAQIPTLQDTEITFQGTNYDIEDELRFLSSSDPKIVEPNGEYFLEFGEGTLGYYYKFSEFIDISKATAFQPLKLNFLKQEFTIIKVEDNKITFFTPGNDYELLAGMSQVIEGKTVTVSNVGSNSAVIDVNGASATINVGSSATLNGLDIYVNYVISRTELGESSAHFYAGKKEIAEDGKVYLSYSNWVWDIGNLTGKTSSQKIGVVNKPIKIKKGECFELPHAFIKVCFRNLLELKAQKFAIIVLDVEGLVNREKPSLTITTPVEGATIIENSPYLEFSSSQDTICYYYLDSNEERIFIEENWAQQHKTQIPPLQVGEHKIRVECIDKWGEDVIEEFAFSVKEPEPSIRTLYYEEKPLELSQEAGQSASKEIVILNDGQTNLTAVEITQLSPLYDQLGNEIVLILGSSNFSLGKEQAEAITITAEIPEAQIGGNYTTQLLIHDLTTGANSTIVINLAVQAAEKVAEIEEKEFAQAVTRREEAPLQPFAKSLAEEGKVAIVEGKKDYTPAAAVIAVVLMVLFLIATFLTKKKKKVSNMHQRLVQYLIMGKERGYTREGLKEHLLEKTKITEGQIDKAFKDIHE